MTIICAYTDGKHTWLGSDTVGVVNIGNSLHPVECGPKVAMAHGWAFGVVGDAYAGDLVEAARVGLFDELDKYERPERTFVGRLHGVWREGGIQPVYGGDAVGSFHNSGLLMCAGRIWDIDSNGATAAIPARTLFARGSAMPWAAAAAYGYQRAKPDTSPEVLIDVALDAAIRFDMQIRGKWTGRL
jgi:hypothetical protein